VENIDGLSRDQIQDYLLDNYWRAYKGRGTFACCTSFGKTVMACKAINRTRAKNPNLPITIILNKTNHLVNWTADLDKFVLPQFRQNINVYIINTYVNKLIAGEITDTENTFIIADEIHNYGGNADEAIGRQFVRMWEVPYKFILGLSATAERLDGLHTTFTQLAPILYTISLEMAVRNGWVAPYQEINLRMNLTHEQKNQYDYYSEQIPKNLKVFDNDFAAATSACNTPAVAAKWAKKKNLPIEAIKTSSSCFLAFMKKRSDLLQQSKAKEDIIVRILTETNCKTIIFSQSIEFIENLKVKLQTFRKCSIYHSKLTKKEKDAALAEFLSGQTDVMLSASALNEGFSDDKLYLGIAAAYNSSATSNVQRKGRVCRLRKDGTYKTAMFVNLVYTSTVEESWLEKAQKDSAPATYLSLEDTITKIERLTINDR
jgi:superfamily II DNA or RNA helicase